MEEIFTIEAFTHHIHVHSIPQTYLYSSTNYNRIQTKIQAHGKLCQHDTYLLWCTHTIATPPAFTNTANKYLLQCPHNPAQLPKLPKTHQKLTTLTWAVDWNIVRPLIQANNSQQTDSDVHRCRLVTFSHGTCFDTTYGQKRSSINMNQFDVMATGTPRCPHTKIHDVL